MRQPKVQLNTTSLGIMYIVGDAQCRKQWIIVINWAINLSIKYDGKMVIMQQHFQNSGKKERKKERTRKDDSNRAQQAIFPIQKNVFAKKYRKHRSR